MPDVDLGEVIADHITVIHELVEIDEGLRMGLAITKDGTIRNPEKVDDARLKTAKVELAVARMIGAADHVREHSFDREVVCDDNLVRKEESRV